MKSKVKIEDIFAADDSRQVIMTVGEMKKHFEREYNRRAQEMFEQIKKDVVAQIMATCLVALQKFFGFGKKRLQRFKSCTEALFVAMAAGGIFGKEFTTQNCIDVMRERYGIDVEAKELKEKTK